MTDRFAYNDSTINHSFEHLARRFNRPMVKAITLMGSHSRGSAGPYSDVDLVRFLEDDQTVLDDSGSHLIDSRLVVISDVTPIQVDDAFAQPERVVETIQGLRRGHALIDPDGYFVAIQQRAHAFQWDDKMQEKANRWASQQMVGWIEEVHKGLEGLRRNDTGRLLHARFGCSWGLARVMCVQRGVLLSSDNALYEEVIAAVGRSSQWTQLYRAVCGAGSDPVTLRDQVTAGLQLYRLTATMLADILQTEDQPIVANTLALINKTFSQTDSDPHTGNE